MAKKSTLEYCEGNPTTRHYWQKIGVHSGVNVGHVWILYKCSQCQKCKSEDVEWVKGGF